MVRTCSVRCRLPSPKEVTTQSVDTSAVVVVSSLKHAVNKVVPNVRRAIAGRRVFIGFM